jgi:hypothetical protein
MSERVRTALLVPGITEARHDEAVRAAPTSPSRCAGPSLSAPGGLRHSHILADNIPLCP